MARFIAITTIILLLAGCTVVKPLNQTADIKTDTSTTDVAD